MARKAAGGTLVESEQNGKGRRPMGNLDAGEILLIVGVAVLLFGAGRIADIGKGLGDALRGTDGDTAWVAAIAFVVTVAIYWLSVSAARHR